MGDEKHLNFSIEATVRREKDTSQSHVGFQFRNGYRVYVRKPGRIELVGPNKARGRGFTRNHSTHKPLKFKIIVVGPVVRFFINGKYEGQFDKLDMTPGPVSLYQCSLQHNVYFDNVKLDTRVEPAQFLVCEPITGEDKALLFDPSKDVHLKFKVTNFYKDAQDAEMGIDLATFDDRPVFITTKTPELIQAGDSKEVSINLGKIPEGFYRLRFLPTGETFPLAVHVKGTVTEDQIKMPKILTGVYWYYLAWDLPPVWWNTYMHAASNDLRKHNFNTIICAGGMPTESIKIAGQYGIRCFTRGAGRRGNVADPNCIGGFIGDEPHKGQEERYIKNYENMLKKYPDKIFTTCMIGDGGVEGMQKWWDAWMPLSEDNRIVRMFRWYGIRNFHLGIKRQYGGTPPLTETLRKMNGSKRPYYFVMPSFGSNRGIKAYFSNPLPSQIKCMMHLGAAFQAKGLFFWTYQTPFPDHDAFVNPSTLLPLDGKWAAAGETAAKIQKNADLLAACTWEGRYKFVEGPNLLEVFQLRRKNDPATYFYVINKDTEQSVKGRLFQLNTNYKLQDLFNEQDIPISLGTVSLMRSDMMVVGGVASISLAPGDGVLLRYTKSEKSTVVAGAQPRVIYPEAISKTPPERIIWLIDLAPIEMPVPGWFPAIRFKGKAWFPDFNSKDLKLYSGLADEGQLYQRSLWAHAETTIKYKIPEGVTTFAAAAGFGNKTPKSSAIFRVLVDGNEKYNSGVMTINTGVKPVKYWRQTCCCRYFRWKNP